MNRRNFLGKASTGLAWGVTTSALSVRGIAAPSNKVSVGVMGVNSRGSALASAFAQVPGVEVSIICDVDERAITKGIKAVTDTGGKAPRSVKDFRRILDDKTIDALVIGAPDHWHAPAAIAACSAGKHAYVEKPCSHNPAEGELLVAASRKFKRLVQMGNQRRSLAKTIEGIEAVRSGAIGRVYYARSAYNSNRESIGHGTPAPVPAWLDYDLWQGPAPRRPFTSNIIHYNWHWFWNWGTGEAGNNGVHTADLCRWGLGVDFPTRVTSSGGRYHWKDDWETPDTQTISMDFDGGKTMLFESLSCNSFAPGGHTGVTFHGDNGTLVLKDSGYTIFDKTGKEPIKTTVAGPEKKVDRTGGTDTFHQANFADAIRSGKPLNSEIAEGHKSTLLMQLGNIALRTGTTLHCDPTNGHIKNNKEAMALWKREYNPAWTPKV